MDKVKKPKPGASKRIKELYSEIRKRPFSSELIDMLKKKLVTYKNPKNRYEL